MKKFTEFFYFGLQGLFLNTVFYLAYLAITAKDYVGPKTAMSVFYLIGMLLSFYFNRTWTFKHEDEFKLPLMRFVLVYGVGYILNLILLIILVDYFNWPHRLIQGAAILLIGILSFFAQKKWVFVAAKATID
jgi:putative flippase GtrA